LTWEEWPRTLRSAPEPDPQKQQKCLAAELHRRYVLGRPVRGVQERAVGHPVARERRSRWRPDDLGYPRPAGVQYEPEYEDPAAAEEIGGATTKQ